MKKTLAVILALTGAVMIPPWALAEISTTTIVVDAVSMRDNDPTIMDINYHGSSLADKVDVRMVAFKGGVRSFANIILPETFVEGTETNLGNNVSIKGHHKISWRVSSDWNIDLAKVSVEFLVKTTPDLIPFKSVTIPAAAGKKAMKLAVSGASGAQLFNAVLWCCADKDPDFSVANGRVYYKGKVIAQYGGCVTRSAYNFIYYLEGSSSFDINEYELEDSSCTLAVAAFWDKLGYHPFFADFDGIAFNLMNMALRTDIDVSCVLDSPETSTPAYKWLDD